MAGPDLIAVGSSPLARGGRRGELAPLGVLGLIPAGAGRTPHCWSSETAAGAHPRWRGADTVEIGTPGPWQGSSPLARGGPACQPQARGTGGLIPAGAGRTVAPGLPCRVAGAHPRWRGADPQLGFGTNVEAGSSPLARGGHRRRPRLVPEPGLIPAGAGRTLIAELRPRRRRAHPRWRGADQRKIRRKHRVTGSSPLARGGPAPRQPPCMAPGLIPAGAGRTSTMTRTCTPSRAHPRWRGADRRRRLTSVMNAGSSPLARGGLGQRRPGGRVRGLIPAGAGRTRRPTLRYSSRRAHPRWRGADWHTPDEDPDPGGSSPLARGGPGDRVDDLGEGGLIPAGAGRTLCRRRASRCPRAHPRWRGADIAWSPSRWGGWGSSPLARGGLHCRRPDHVLPGLIPAGAGRTTTPRTPPRSARAHPRWRGADVAIGAGAWAIAGSSPLARGGRAELGRRRVRRGLIPAGAGRTCGSP